MIKKELIDNLCAAGMNYTELSLGSRTIVVTEYGGRVFGPFGDDDEQSLFWISDVFKDSRKLAEFTRNRNWNIGGDRIWIAPEIQFSVGDRTRFWDTLDTPQDIDPGNYKLENHNNKVTLSQIISLKAHNIASGEIRLKLNRTIQEANNPLRSLGAAYAQIPYCGYEQLLTIDAQSKGNACAEYWNLMQVIPNGHIYIPMYHAHKGENYYEPVGELETVCTNGVVLKATGENRYKVGYKSAFVCGRLAYATRVNDQYVLIVKNFPNDPSNIYGEEPPDKKGENGFSIHVYNDDGNSGGFTELECNMQSVGAAANHSTSVDRLSTWVFSGTKEQTDMVASALCGFDNIEY